MNIVLWPTARPGFSNVGHVFIGLIQLSSSSCKILFRVSFNHIRGEASVLGGGDVVWGHLPTYFFGRRQHITPDSRTPLDASLGLRFREIFTWALVKMTDVTAERLS